MSVRSGILIILAVTIWRIVALLFDQTDLFVDEAQYWLWSQHLALGYYSKPPMIAWVLSAVTGLAGSSDIFWIRMPGPLFHMATSLVLMAAARRLVGAEIAGWVGVTCVTYPAVALSSVLFSTDDILLLFMAIALWAYIVLTERRSAGHALVMGIAIGCAFLSKYAVLFIMPGGAIALALIPSARISWRDFFIAVLAAAIVAMPNLWWNLQHDITTVRHTQDIAHWSDLKLNIGNGFGFFLAQFGVVGPVVFAAMLWATARMITGKSEPREKLLVWLSMPIVALITLQAFIAKAYANWAVTAYVAGTILAVWLLMRLWPKGLKISLAINGFVTILFPILTIFAPQAVLPNGDSVLKRFLGRSELSRKAGDLARQAGTTIIVSDNRDILADFFHTLRDTPLRFYARPPAAFPKNYYEQELALPPQLSEPVLFVTRKSFDCALDKPVLVETWTPDSGYYAAKPIHAYKTVPGCLTAVQTKTVNS